MVVLSLINIGDSSTNGADSGATVIVAFDVKESPSVTVNVSVPNVDAAVKVTEEPVVESNVPKPMVLKDHV